MENVMKMGILDERKAEEDRDDLKERTITKTEVKSMGFTEKLIKELLPEPQLATNPVYKSAAKMKLWKGSDVEDAMKSPVFQKSLEKRKKYQAAAKKAVATKVSKLKAETDEFLESVNIKHMDIDALREAAIYAKQAWYDIQNYRYDAVYFKDAYSADEDTVKRWMVNFVRHEMTSYDEQLYHMKGRTGIHDLYHDIHNLILDKIALVYPELAQECENQKSRAL